MPVDRQQIHQVLQALLDEGASRFRGLSEGLGLTPLQSVGSPSDPAVYLHCNDTHYEPMWRIA